MNLHCTWRDIMREAAQRLTSAGVDGAARDARLLLAQALGIEPLDVILRETDSVDAAGLAAFEALVKRREAGEPVSRIRCWREFHGHRFAITPDVLDPRPETELLVEHGLRLLPQGGRVIDLGVGSGCILLSVLAARDDATGIGVDLSPRAVDVARDNAQSLGLAARAQIIERSFADAQGEWFDLALSNPPYISRAEVETLDKDVRNHDPAMALSPGDDALAAYRMILGAMPGWLKPGGWIGVEVGAGQSGDVSRLMSEAGLIGVEVFDDLAGMPRALFGRRPGG
jgi:release factor glutamine methyltransferase